MGSVTSITVARQSSLKPDIMADTPPETFSLVLEADFVALGLALVFHGIHDAMLFI
jgi:hypothetical protein